MGKNKNKILSRDEFWEDTMGCFYEEELREHFNAVVDKNAQLIKDLEKMKIKIGEFEVKMPSGYEYNQAIDDVIQKLKEKK